MPWQTNAFVGGTGVTLGDMRISPCPRCGGEGLVSGEYLKMLQFAAEQLRQLDRDRLLELRETLQEARERGDHPAEAAAKIEEAYPDLAPAARWLASRSNRMELGMWIGTLLALITLLVTLRGPATVSPQQMQEMVRDVVGQTTKEGVSPDRNQPCPCGSGRKWKHCHGAPGGAVQPSTPVGQP